MCHWAQFGYKQQTIDFLYLLRPHWNEPALTESHIGITILGLSQPAVGTHPPAACSLPEFSPLVLGPATTLLQPPAQQCSGEAVKCIEAVVNAQEEACVLKQHVWWYGGSTRALAPHNKAGQVEKNPDQGSQFASTELAHHMRTPAINAHTQCTQANLRTHKNTKTLVFML